ncbi:MAG: dockerin type I repeat-containing protein, partial [Lachnospiraceae bacterium]
GSTFHMYGGTITGNTGYDVYVNNKNVAMYMSGTAKVGNLFLSTGKAINVEGSGFTSSGVHATITPESYADGTVVATYAAGLTPNVGDFALADSSYMLYVDGQNLKIKAGTLLGDTNEDGAITAVDALKVLLDASSVSPERGDVNGDGTVDSKDAELILDYATGKIKAF